MVEKLQSQFDELLKDARALFQVASYLRLFFVHLYMYLYLWKITRVLSVQNALYSES
jgi:hypothetical protein